MTNNKYGNTPVRLSKFYHTEHEKRSTESFLYKILHMRLAV